MTKAFTINKWPFRLLAPLLFGLLVYVLVLLFFDSIDKLFIHFINIEYFLCVVLCILSFEVLHLIFNLCESKCNTNIAKRIFIQLSFSVISTLLITSIIIYLYFSLILKLYSFTSELIIFSSLLTIITVFYNMIYFGEYLQEYNSQSILDEQNSLQRKAQNEWTNFRNRINPKLLYKSLEHLIGLAHINKSQADEFVTDLSKLYRKILNINDELISINDELEIINQLKTILEKCYNDVIKIHLKSENKTVNKHIVPGIFILHIQDIIELNIASFMQPLIITIIINESSIILEYQSNKKLNPEKKQSNLLEHSNEKFEWFTDKKIEISQTNKTVKIAFPLISINN